MHKKRELQLRELKTISHTKLTQYGLPLLGFDPSHLLLIPMGYKIVRNIDILNYLGFVNIYSECINHHTDYPNSLILLFNPNAKSLAIWHLFRNIYSNYVNFLGDFDPFLGGVGIIFQISKKEWYPIKQHILDGKYSRIKEYKDYCNKFIVYEEGRSNAKYQLQVIAKYPSLIADMEQKLGIEITKDMELDSKPDLDKEILNLDNLQFAY